ncbi:G-patch domain [Mycena chlorophos]|uniref:G-patch domain n=1 Tax=Mycena chlorophos TaxID=658473 RepID=A0A8H6RWI4_MYCCL|nr:G-patch domain [Mycena chlorophos]
MTSRLKKRLDNLGVDAGSARANENFCLIGTPLPPLEKSKDTGEFVPLWKQEVRDEKGRRRLHGAFTGGFSAGYFNTVGSKEGWTPSTFVSSRGDRSKKKTARPEDFMDEEDLQDLRENRNLVDTTDEMDLTAGTPQGQGDDEQDSVARALEASMLPAAKDSAGARILKKMGWRIGQGIGPRVTLRQRKLQDLVASGRRFTEADLAIPEDDEEAKRHTYAPKDISVLVAQRKDNTHGLGYRPGMSLNEGPSGGAGPSGPKLAGGFGLGALNDADEDDLDVYDSGARTQDRNRTAYDIIDREEDEKISIGSRADRNVASRTRPAGSTHNFQDGRPVLAGFVLSDKPVSEDRWFPLPEVPPGWKPDPKRVWNKENVEESDASMQEGVSRNKFSADQRGSMLGETPLPSAPRSVFEYMSQKDRERIQRLTSSASAPPPQDDGPIPPPSAPPPTAITIPRTEPHIALAALNGGFVPFATNPAKQARYTAYLQSQTSADSIYRPPEQLPGQPVDEYNKELEDYAKAAVIFKPLSGAMAGRFTSAVVVEHGPQITEGLYMPKQEDFDKKEEELKKEREDKVSPKVHAARLGMYGPMTRETEPWQPARLLCKRFRVKDPNPTMDASEEGAGAASTFGFGQASSSAGILDQFTPVAAPVASTSAAENSAASSTGPRDLANIGLGEDETQGRDTLTYQRPAMDVFKAIFASDDEDSDDEAEKPVDDPEPPEPEPVIPAAPPAAVQPEPSMVDMNTFKPTFIPREGKGKKDSERSKEKKKRDKERKSTVSFIEDEGEEGALQIVPKDKGRPKKKRRKEKDVVADDDDSMWVEKPAPEIVRQLPVVTPTTVEDAGQMKSGRKRAIDFM